MLNWYRQAGRKLPWRETRDPYHIWTSEVMLQQTQVKTAIPYYLNFIRKWPGVHDFAAADLEQVLKIWEGLGYYARARNFHKAACLVSACYNGIVPDDFKTFLALPGVGDYIGSAVFSIAFSRPHAVVDGNVKRVLARLFRLEHPANVSAHHRGFKTIADSLLDMEHPGDYNQAVMELGALVCTPKAPRCSKCPVISFCKSHATGQTDLYPKRAERKKIPTHQISVGIVIRNKKMLITRRKLDGLLGGLWEFPGGKREPGETSEQACIREIKEETGLDVSVDRKLTQVRHTYTHFKIEMDVFYCSVEKGRVCLNGPVNHQWVTLRQLEKYAFPGANNKFIPLIQIPDTI